MKRHTRNLILAAVIALSSGFATTQTIKPEKDIETEFSQTRLVRDKLDKAISGDVLVYGSAIQVKKQVGIDNVKMIRRQTVYNCARNEFVIKDISVFNTDGDSVSNHGIKTDVILTPQMSIYKQEVAFMCDEVKPK